MFSLNLLGIVSPISIVSSNSLVGNRQRLKRRPHPTQPGFYWSRQRDSIYF